MSRIYEYKVKNSKDETIGLDQYRGKVMLIVNTASKCGFTYQYEGLQKLYDSYHDKGLEILAFPCNQFANQEAGSNEEIQSFCQINYGLSFPVFGKIDVNGKNADPLYQYLKKQQGIFLFNHIKWNFTKFLVTREGQVIKRYASSVKPEALVRDIESLL